jgi:hypothetical protein
MQPSRTFTPARCARPSHCLFPLASPFAANANDTHQYFCQLLLLPQLSQQLLYLKEQKTVAELCSLLMVTALQSNDNICDYGVCD